MGKYDRGREEWKELLDVAHNVIPAGNARGQDTDIKLLDLYLRHESDKALKTHQKIMSFLTGTIAILTAINIFLTFSK